MDEFADIRKLPSVSDVTSCYIGTPIIGAAAAGLASASPVPILGGAAVGYLAALLFCGSDKSPGPLTTGFFTPVRQKISDLTTKGAAVTESRGLDVNSASIRVASDLKSSHGIEVSNEDAVKLVRVAEHHRQTGQTVNDVPSHHVKTAVAHILRQWPQQKSA